MGSAPMVTSPRTRIALSAACATALALATPIVEASPASAADTITAADQPYFAYYHLDQARAKGYTGKGVTVALIDGPVDTSVAELSGASISDKSPCPVNPSNDSRQHGTADASLLVAREYGVAPDVTLNSYQTMSSGSTADSSCKDSAVIYKHASLINHAINDGAQIISISISSNDRNASLKWAMARAMSSGTIIVAAIGNSASDNDSGSLATWSGVVGVSAVDINGARADYSSWGQGVTTAAVGGPIKAYDYGTSQIIETKGTSISTPIVAGFLALARQKWPDATANQLLQLLVHTTVNTDGGWNQYTGYGLASPATMINTDPSQYPDENPLADKGGGTSPTPDEVRQYADGIVDPSEIIYDNSYTYRGLNETTLTSTNNPYPTHIGTSPRYHTK
mgnify:FL=1